MSNRGRVQNPSPKIGLTNVNSETLIENQQVKYQIEQIGFSYIQIIIKIKPIWHSKDNIQQRIICNGRRQ